MACFFDKHQKKLFWGLLLLGGVFLCWKAQYGCIFNDEPFILTLGHRMLKGDRLFVDEWNTAQLFSFFILPLVKLYTAIAESTAELILFVRYVYVAWWLAVSCVLYHRFKHYGPISLFAVLFFLLFTPLDVMSVTYNVMALSCMTLFATYFLTQGTPVRSVLTGMVLALGVLASPYAVLIYWVWAVAVLVLRLPRLRARPIATCPIFDFKTFLYVTAGAVALAVAFCGYLLYIGLPQVLGYFDHALVNASSSFGAKLLGTCKALFLASPFQTALGPIVLLVSLLDLGAYARIKGGAGIILHKNAT